MMDMVVHPHTQKGLGEFTKSPSHALILAGPTGSGKAILAARLAENVLGIDELDKYAYKLVLTAENASIGIDEIRRLEAFLSLRVPLSAPHNRVIIIHDAQLLTLEAQNALLKTLEEPPEGTIIILTTSQIQALLPTVRSRAQLMHVNKPDRDALNEYFTNENFSIEQIEKAYSISGGLPGLMAAVLEQTDHPLLQATEQARALLRASTYDRLILIDSLSKQRQLAIDTAFILQQMAHISLQSATGAAVKRWQAILEAGFATTEALINNAQPKLALTDLALAF